ncbi:LysR substrate-binding domain-containing protein [Caballeronia terrestris]|uniref:LysR substrate-binding domain-containing protein n=1 Tax=Caballeronia terrestris TaxID=1226301 RepID=UPI001F263375|nr:LysR substrate-binding domain-containing protein [Caballeronia terrestris]
MHNAIFLCHFAMDRKITLRHLEAFRAIMVRKSVTAAAEMLEVTQPVVTRLLADLEDRIGLVLFLREKGRLVPTAEAALLFADVHQSLVGIERIANAASNLKTLKLGHIEIAAAPTMAHSFLPRAIANFATEHPEALVTMHMHSSAIVLDMVASDRCDLGFAMVPLRATRHGSTDVLVSAKMVAVVPSDHRLACRDVLTPEDFQGESFISFTPLMEARTKIDSIMLSHNVNRRINVETQISSVILKLVEAGAGLSIIDALTATGYTGAALKFIPFEPNLISDYSIAISQRNSSTLILKPFIDHARREIRAMLPKSLVV